MSLKQCSVEGCEKDAHAKGYCNVHYGRVRRYGNPHTHQFVKHGLSHTVANSRWKGMRRRCLLECCPDYPEYGGRGIKIFDRWVNSFTAFYEDMGEPPTPKHSLERIDVDGNYEPSNCYWADPSTQAANQRMRKYNTSGYLGAYLSDGKWQCKVAWQGVEHYLGVFNTAKEAATWRDAYVIANNWPHRLNFMEKTA